MKIMLIWILAGCVVLVLGFGGYVRLSPVDPMRWHVDPRTAPAPDGRGVAIRGLDSTERWDPFPADPEVVLRAFDQVALSTERTTKIAGSIDEGRITYVTRTRFWGFPDFTTVEATSTADGTDLGVLARAQFGQSDLGVNRARIDNWRNAVVRLLAAEGG